jgi:hypothetical protein
MVQAIEVFILTPNECSDSSEMTVNGLTTLSLEFSDVPTGKQEKERIDENFGQWTPRLLYRACILWGRKVLYYL